MEYIFSYIDNLFYTAIIIIGIYCFLSFLLSDMTKVWFKKLSKAPELTQVLIFLIIFFYPILFLSLVKDWFYRGKESNDWGPNQWFIQLHVDKDDERRIGGKVFFIGWRHLLGLHLPILLLWLAMWLYIINLIVKIFF